MNLFKKFAQSFAVKQNFFSHLPASFQQKYFHHVLKYLVVCCSYLHLLSVCQFQWNTLYISRNLSGEFSNFSVRSLQSMSWILTVYILLYTMYFQPDPDSLSFRRPQTEMNIASGCPQFALHADVESSNFLINDCIYVRVSVESSRA